LLPGHGGVVDRFDSLFTSGIIYYYLVLAWLWCKEDLSWHFSHGTDSDRFSH
jgi:hypothetical protein